VSPVRFSAPFAIAGVSAAHSRRSLPRPRETDGDLSRTVASFRGLAGVVTNPTFTAPWIVSVRRSPVATSCSASSGAGAWVRCTSPSMVHLGRLTAIKLLHAELGRNEDAESRFRREALLAAKISHPSVAQIYDFDRTADGEFLIAMEYVEGHRRAAAPHLGAVPNRRGAPHRRKRRRWPRPRALPRHPPPRPQAREPDAHRERRRQAARLRHCP
jgi:hypothetical protein